MFTTKKLILLGALILVAVLIAACGTPGPQGEPGPAGPAGPKGDPGPALTAADLSCTECHNDTALLGGKQYAWQTSRHGTTGTAWLEEGYNQNCAGCHSGAAAIDRFTAGQSYADFAAAKDITLPDTTPQTCRTCHQIHTTYSTDDFALRIDTPVALVLGDTTFDGGAGNLCVNCHQARRYLANFAAKDKDGNVIPDKYQTSIRFNSHPSVQTNVFLGVLDVNTVLGVEGKPAPHYTKVEDTCVGCHLGANKNHTFRPEVATCTECHSDATSLDINGVQTAVEEKLTELKDALTAKGLLDDKGAVITKNADGSPVLLDPGPAAALYVYGALEEDASKGVHNPGYYEALLEASLAALK